MQPSLYVGAKCTFKINDDIVAAGFVAGYQIATSITEIETLDNVFPSELAPSRIRVTMDVKVYRHPDNDPVASGFAPGYPSVGSVHQTQFLSSKYLTVTIKDSLDNNIIHLPKAWLVSRSGSMGAQDFVTETWSITGMGYFGPLNQ
jgi:hypothetical protein